MRPVGLSRRLFGRALSVAILLLLLLLPLLGGCSRDGAAPADGPIPLKLGVSQSILSTPLLLALDLGLFADAGLAVEEHRYYSGRQSFEALMRGDVRLCTVADAAVVKAALRGDAFTVYASFVTSRDHGEVIARRDLGIADGADLAGRRVGVFRNTTGDYQLSVLLLEQGLGDDAVERIDLPPQRQQQALLAGEVAAVSTWQPHAYRISQALGDRALSLRTAHPYRISFNLVGRPVAPADEPAAAELMARTLEALEGAIAFYRDEPAQARTLIARRLGLPAEAVDAIIGRYDFRLSLDQGLILTLESQARWLRARDPDLTGELPNFLDHIDARALRRRAPNAVTLLD
jgi:ABC-type nitrate/sulfonate/bicarbonate transport system substrate-binding protein